MPRSSPMHDALARVLRPIVRLLIARDLRYPEMAEVLKEIYVETSGRYFRLGGKRLTDSRISMLTGLQRKDVKALRTKLDAAPPDQADSGMGPLPRILAHWTSGAAYTDTSGAPRILPRIGAGASFATLVAEVSRDIHPRTVLDEFTRLGLAILDKEHDQITLLKTSYLPSRDDAALLGYLGANLGDHAEAATLNTQAAPGAGPFFERAVHYNQLSVESLDELEALAKEVQGDALATLNARALALQTRDAETDAPKGRFRCGAFVYRSHGPTPLAEI